MQKMTNSVSRHLLTIKIILNLWMSKRKMLITDHKFYLFSFYSVSVFVSDSWIIRISCLWWQLWRQAHAYFTYKVMIQVIKVLYLSQIYKTLVTFIIEVLSSTSASHHHDLRRTVHLTDAVVFISQESLYKHIHPNLYVWKKLPILFN